MKLLLVATVAGAYALWRLFTHFPIPDATITTVAGAYASVSVTMLGFALAVLAILISISDRRLVRNLARTGHFKRLTDGLYWSAAYYGVTMLMSLLTLFFQGVWMTAAIAVSTGCMMGATLSLGVMSARFWKVLNVCVPRDNTPLE